MLFFVNQIRSPAGPTVAGEVGAATAALEKIIFAKAGILACKIKTNWLKMSKNSKNKKEWWEFLSVWFKMIHNENNCVISSVYTHTKYSRINKKSEKKIENPWGSSQ